MEESKRKELEVRLQKLILQSNLAKSQTPQGKTTTRRNVRIIRRRKHRTDLKLS